MIYGYGRVSTRGQAKDGNSLEAQENALRSAGVTKIYADAFTGTRTKRPELDKLMSVLQSGDTLIVTKLDRIARSANIILLKSGFPHATNHLIVTCSNWIIFLIFC